MDSINPSNTKIIKRLNMHICAILLAKPSMQVLYERVLRRPYPRSQRHVYIGMSRPSQYLKSACLSLFFPLHSSLLLLVENSMSSQCPTFQTQYIPSFHCSLSFIFVTWLRPKLLITPWFCRMFSLWSRHIKLTF